MVQARRRSSKEIVVPAAILALGELGKSESFTLRTAGQPTATSASTLSNLHNSCPNLGFDIDDCSRAALQPTKLEMIPSMSDVSTFNFHDAAEPLADAADFLGGLGSSLLADNDATTGAKAEGMNLVSHALLDFPATMAKAAVATKAAEVAGRLFVLGQGMLPGHEMMHDELAFQVGFLAVSCNALYQTVMPKIKASQASKFLSPGDRKAFREIFKPAGMSWTQYREMNVNSMEWVELAPGQTMDHDAAYWLYEGAMEIEGEGTVESGCLLGEDHIAKTLGMFNGEEISSPKATVAGPSGAKALKVDTEKLQELMKNDNTIQAPMGRLLFNSMQGQIERSSMANQAA